MQWAVQCLQLLLSSASCPNWCQVSSCCCWWLPSSSVMDDLSLCIISTVHSTVLVLGSCVSLDMKDVQATSLVGIGKFPPTLYSAVVSPTFLFVTLSSQEMPRVLCCHLWCTAFRCFITVHAKLSGTVYCNWSCVFVGLWVCYHDNLKLCASICTKLGL